MAFALGHLANPAIAALDIPRAIQAITYALFDLQPRDRDPVIPVAAATASLAAHVGIALALIAIQVRRTYRSGIGGAS